MNIPRLMLKAKKIASDNSPVILTAIGVAGTITTAYLAAKASFKAAPVLILNHAEWREEVRQGVPKESEPTALEKAQLVWKLYIPAVTTGALTCGCIVAANYIGTKRAAALAAAYTISEAAFSEYKDKVTEIWGEDAEKEVRDSVAQDRVRANPPGEIIFGTGSALCHDGYSGRYFMSDKETIRRAANDIGYQILHSDYATMTDFYDKVGLEETSASSEMGWNSEYPLELLFSTIEAPNGTPCLSYDFAVVPIRDPWRFR